MTEKACNPKSVSDWSICFLPGVCL